MTGQAVRYFSSIAGDPGPVIGITNSILGNVFASTSSADQPEEATLVVPVGDLWRLVKANCLSQGVSHYSETIDLDSLALIRRSGRIIFDISNEGPVFTHLPFEDIHSFSAQTGIPLSRIAFVSQNRHLKRDYVRAFGATGLELFSFDFFVLQSIFQARAEEVRPADTVSPSSAFTCLNHAPRPHRTLLVLALIAEGLDAQGLLSFSASNEKGAIADPGLDPMWRREKIEPFLNRMPEMMARCPIILDDHTSTGNELALDLGARHYRRSHFGIVGETDFTSGEIRRITEKSIKPLAASRPVIIFGNPGSLSLLRELGFETFHPFIDETYDSVSDPTERFLMAFNAVVDSVENAATISAALAETCEFNRAHLKSGGLERYFQLHLDPILRWLGDRNHGPAWRQTVYSRRLEIDAGREQPPVVPAPRRGGRLRRLISRLR